MIQSEHLPHHFHRYSVTGLVISQPGGENILVEAEASSHRGLFAADCIADTLLALSANTAPRHRRASLLLVARLLEAGPHGVGDAAGGVGGPVGPGRAHRPRVIQALHGPAVMSLQTARVEVDEQ